MTALRKHTASALERGTVDAGTYAPAETLPEAFAYDDDVTPEAIELLRKKAEKSLPQGKFRVIDGFAGDSATAVG